MNKKMKKNDEKTRITKQYLENSIFTKYVLEV